MSKIKKEEVLLPATPRLQFPTTPLPERVIECPNTPPKEMIEGD